MAEAEQWVTPQAWDETHIINGDTFAFVAKMNQITAWLQLLTNELNAVPAAVQVKVDDLQASITALDTSVLAGIEAARTGALDDVGEVRVVALTALNDARTAALAALQAFVDTAQQHSDAAADSDQSAQAWAVAVGEVADGLLSARAYAEAAQLSAQQAASAAAGQVLDDSVRSDSKAWSSEKTGAELDALAEKVGAIDAAPALFISLM